MMGTLDIRQQWMEGQIGQQIAGLKVLSVMVHPRSKERRQEFEGAWILDYIDRLNKAGRRDVADMAMQHFWNPEQYPDLLKAPSLKEIRSHVHKALRHGMVAGDVLKYVYRLDKYKHKASISLPDTFLTSNTRDEKRQEWVSIHSALHYRTLF